MDLAPFLSHGILREVPAPLLEDLVSRSRQVRLQPGECLLSPGQETRELYFLLSGSLRVNLDSRDSPHAIPVAAGEIVGEMSIIEQRPASAWVVAQEPCCLLAMPERLFWDDLVTVPEANRRLMQLLIARVRGTDLLLQQEFERKVRYEILQRELASAGKIQANLLPSARPLFASPAVDAHASIRPAREVGGDFYDAVALDEHRLCVVVGDVSGKGMPAALFMVRAVTLLRAALLGRGDPAAILPGLNRQLCDANDEFMFVTLAVAILDTSDGRLTYLNAGHNPPVLATGGLGFAYWTPPKGALLGVAPGASFEVRQAVLSPGDTLLLYTDGVTEAENGALGLYGNERLTQTLSSGFPHASAEAVVAAVEASVTAFAGGAPQSDDITLLALRYRGPSPAQLRG
jgi:sigma-B regulation protein RsbU (phosphoserine phosphatase)